MLPTEPSPSGSSTRENAPHYDALLEMVAYAAGQFSSSSPWEKTIGNVLKRLGKTLGACRAYIFENHYNQKGQLLTSQRHEWVAPGITPQIDNPTLQNSSYTALGFQRWVMLLSQDHIIHSRICDLPTSEQPVLQSQAIRSIAVAPVFAGNKWWGFIGLDNTQHKQLFSTAEINALKVIARFLGALITWKSVTKTREEYQHQLESLLAKELSHHRLIDAIDRIQSLFIQDTDPSVLFGNILQEILALSGSEFSFLGEVHSQETGAPYLRTLAISKAADHRAQSSGFNHGIELYPLEPFIETVITSGKAVIANDFDNKSISPIKRFLGLPFYHHEALLGVIGVANRSTPYDEGLAEYLSPFLSTCGSILAAYHNDQRRRDAENRLRLTAKVFENAIEGVIITDAKTCIIDINQAFTNISGFTSQEIIGKPLSFLRAKRHNPLSFKRIWSLVKNTGEWQGELWSRRKSGENYPTWIKLSAIKNSSEVVTHYVATVSDITQRKQTEQQLYYLAYHDTLTGLPNRSLFLDRLKHAIDHACRHHQRLALLFIDLDRFKFINDTLGHRVGDNLLQQVAKRMQTQIRVEDTIARLGGDEFTVIIENFLDTSAITMIAQKLITACEKPFNIKGRELFISASIGISLYPEDGDNANALLQHADAAMYRAKEKGKRNYQFFTPEMNTAAAERLALENRLRKAVALGEFQLLYQPIIDIGSGVVVSVEALVRWINPEIGLISPDKFIPLAEETGLILPIGEWILQTACAQTYLWNQNNPHPLRIAINLSARQLQQPGFLEQTLKIIQKADLPPHCLTLEFTESTIMEDIDLIVDILHRFKKIGCQLSLDDFGTGYSSLAYLKRLPVDAVKIDRSFVQDIGVDPDDAVISSAVTSMAHSLKRRVIAEGVETRAQLEFLDNIGVNEAQGYFIGPPVPSEELGRTLKDKRCWH